MNDDIIIIDNVIPKDYSDHIKNLMTGWDFGWVFNQNMVSPDAELQGESNHAGFNHFFYEKQQAVSQHFNFIYPLVLLGRVKLALMRINLLYGVLDALVMLKTRGYTKLKC